MLFWKNSLLWKPSETQKISLESPRIKENNNFTTFGKVETYPKKVIKTHITERQSYRLTERQTERNKITTRYINKNTDRKTNRQTNADRETGRYE